MNSKKVNPYVALFVTFFKASAFTFSGGLAILAAIERDLVEKYQLLGKDEFMEYATLSQTMPGVIALNCAALVGRNAAGTLGMLWAVTGAIIPAFVLMVLAVVLMDLIPKQPRFLSAMRGIRAASAALVLSAAFSLGRHNIKSMFAVIVMLAALCMVVLGGAGAPTIVVLAGITGFLYQRIRRHFKGREKQNG